MFNRIKYLKIKIKAKKIINSISQDNPIKTYSKDMLNQYSFKFKSKQEQIIDNSSGIKGNDMGKQKQIVYKIEIKSSQVKGIYIKINNLQSKKNTYPT